MTASGCTIGITIIDISVFTIGISTRTTGIIGAGTGSVRTNGGGVTRCGGRAAEPPRSAAPQATREAKANADGGDDVRSDQKETGRAAG